MIKIKFRRLEDMNAEELAGELVENDRKIREYQGLFENYDIGMPTSLRSELASFFSTRTERENKQKTFDQTYEDMIQLNQRQLAIKTELNKYQSMAQ